MILSKEQQARFIYFSTLSLLILISIPLIVYINKIYDMKNPANIIVMVLGMGIGFFLSHQILIHIMSKASQRNQLRQEDISFASYLVYSKIQGVDFKITKVPDNTNLGYHLNYQAENVEYEHIRKRALFALLSIENTKNVVLSAELRGYLHYVVEISSSSKSSSPPYNSTKVGI